MEINMREIEAKDVETIRALVEYAWKQENIDRISGEIKKYIEKIADEVKQSVEKRILSDYTRVVDARVSGEIKVDIKGELASQMTAHVNKVVEEIKEDLGIKVAGEKKEDSDRRFTERQRNVSLYLVLALTLASIGLGIAIAVLAGLIS